jgi:YD repeat-containing protein
MRGSIRGMAAGLALVLGALWSGPAQAQTSGTRTSAFAYNANTGLLTQEVIEPDTPALRLQTDYTYDAFGHKVTVAVSGTDIATRTAATTYDAKGQFPTSAANALSQAESWEYDARFGTPTKHTGPNGLVTTWSYDDFGRKTFENRADGTHTVWQYHNCAEVTFCFAGSAYMVVEGHWSVSIRRRPQGALAGSRWQGRCGQAACWVVWLSRAAFQFQGSRAWIWCTG